MQVTRLEPQEWKELSESAHLICFDEIRTPDMERIDYALLVVDENVPQAYMTCREHDAESVYMQFGGAFPSCKGTTTSFRAYQMLLQSLKEAGYKRASTLIENKNHPMMRFAMKCGLLVSGVRYFKGSILLEHYVEFQEETCGN